MYRSNSNIKTNNNIRAKSLNIANMSTGSTSTESSSTTTSASQNTTNNNYNAKSKLSSDQLTPSIVNKEFHQEEHPYEEDIYDEEDEDDDDDDENEESEEEISNQIHPISEVKVKYAVSYDYDEKIFELVKGEKLELYEKTNQDWWLCSHLNDKAKFFVPASYVEEIIERKFNMKPPPRPPPPPINLLKQITSKNFDDADNKPQVKPRQIYENINKSTTKSTRNDSNNDDLNDIYENLSDLTLNSVHQVMLKNNNDMLSYDRRESSESPNKIISELDECLDSQEFAFNLNSNSNQLIQQKSTNNSNNNININTNNSNNSENKKGSINTTSNDTSTTTIGTNTTNITNNLGTNSTPEPDYDENDHIYQNLPRSSRSASINSNNSTKLNNRLSIDKKFDKSELNQNLQEEEDDYFENHSEKDCNKYEIDFKNGEHVLADELAEENQYEDGDLKIIKGVNKSSVKSSKKDEKNEKNNEKEDDNQQIDEYDENDEEVEENDEDDDDDDDEEDEDDDIEIPEGWKVGMSNCKRKFFYNTINKDRWYVNHDDNGKCYFYNANNESVWELPQLYPSNKNDNKNNFSEEIYEDDDEMDRTNHFKRDFDSDLSTFKNLYSRLSLRSKPNANDQNQPNNKQDELNAGASAVSASTAYNYNATTSSSISSLNQNQTSENMKSSILFNQNSKESSSTHMSHQPTISYSNRPPSDLSNKFKCIVLAKNGKRVRKKNSENYKVILISTKIGFVKEGKLNSHPKMEFSLDFKGGKCYKIENKSKVNNSNSNNNKDTNNNNNGGNNEDTSSKNAKEKLKEINEITELVGTRCAFVIETTNGYKILIISDNEKIVDEWVYAINSIITQFQSEFSPIYEGPELIHSTKKINDHFPSFDSSSGSSSSNQKLKLPFLTSTTSSTQSSSENSKSNKNKNKELEGDELEGSAEDNLDDNDINKKILVNNNCRKKYKLLDKKHDRKKASVDAISYKKRDSASFKIDIKQTNINDENSYINKDLNVNNELQRNEIILSTSSSSNLASNSSSDMTTMNNSFIYVEKKEVRNIIIKTLNAFLKRRPPIETLKSQGIIKECVFGSNLINLCKKEKRNFPMFVEEIITAIETKGLDMDGIYRISGNLVDVQKVRQLVEHGKHNFKDFDIHVLCGALKTFFRELEDPLVPFSMHQYFIESMKIQDKHKRFACVHELIKKMPFNHRETLRYLLQHLLKVVMLSKENRMTVQNIALVFGPNIMRSNPISESGTFGFSPNIMTQNMVVEYMLNNFKELYSFQTNSIFSTDYQ